MSTGPGRIRRRRSSWTAVILAALVAATALAIAATRGEAPTLGTIQPEHTTHEFGTVRMEGGLLTATFPLTVDGVVDAVDLTTS